MLFYLLLFQLHGFIVLWKGGEETKKDDGGSCQEGSHGNNTSETLVLNWAKTVECHHLIHVTDFIQWDKVFFCCRIVSAFISVNWLLIFRKYCCSTFLDLGLCRDMQSHYICLFPTYVCLNACKFNLTGFAMYPSFFSSVRQIKWINPLKRKFHQLVSGEKTCEVSSVLIIHEYM